MADSGEGDRDCDAPARGSGARRFLGIDTALRTTGFGVIDMDARQPRAIDYGVIKTARGQRLSECLRRLAGGVRELLDRYAPDAAVVEGAFYSRNVKTAMLLGAARGAVIAVLAEHGTVTYEYAPRRVKQAVCGHGNASKEQVALLVGRHLSLPLDGVHDDATDALALALCHFQTCATANGLLVPEPL